MNAIAEKTTWMPVCALDDILPNTGVCALVEGRHIAIFRLSGDAPQLYALDNIDPNSGVSVLSRGLVGNLGDRLVVASPVYKQHFDLRTGECLESPENSVQAYPVQLESGTVWVSV
jgi:nitrite reductase (NADH) small subunit